MTERQEIKHVLIDVEKYSDSYPPTNAMDFAGWLDGLIQQVPQEYRDKVVIEFSAACQWDNDVLMSVEVYYMRPETDEELHKRHAKAGMEKWEQTKRELALLAELKAKYERPASDEEPAPSD